MTPATSSISTTLPRRWRKRTTRSITGSSTRSTGLEAPTLERIAIWLWNRLQNRVPGLAEIEIARDSCHEGCIYAGPPALRHAAE